MAADTSFREWLAAHPPADERFTQTLAGVAEPVRDGEELRFCVRELLDEFALRGRDELRIAAIRDEPAATGDERADAYLGALAEHLAATHGLPRPAWSVGRSRFLEAFWFPSYVVGGAAIALAYDARRATRDVDAVFEPRAEIYAVAAEVGERLDLPPGWLNDAVKGFLAGEDPDAAPVLEAPGLRVLAASPRMLLSR